MREFWKHKSAIFLLDALVILECVLLMTLSTNPFFGEMNHPTAGFISFMILQLLFLGGAFLCGCGMCVHKVKFVEANRLLFIAHAINNSVYVIIFVVKKDYENAGIVLFAALADVLGMIICRAYLVLLIHSSTDKRAKVPTTSPSMSPTSYQHQKIRV